MNPLELTLGIMTAVGGFVDISELAFAAKAGSTFGYALIWVFAFSTIGIIVFSEMSGRVAAVAKRSRDGTAPRPRGSDRVPIHAPPGALPMKVSDEMTSQVSTAPPTDTVPP